MIWTVRWMDEEGNRQNKTFHYSTAATHFVCWLHSTYPETDIIFESRGGDYADVDVCRDEEELFQIPEAKVINVTGAGDAFMAGLAYCFLKKVNSREAARFALGASAMAISHAHTINPHLSVANINLTAGKIKC